MGRKALLISENKKLSQVLLPSLKAPPFEIALDQASSVDGAIIEKGGEDPYDLVILDLDPIISDMPGSVRRLREMNPFPGRSSSACPPPWEASSFASGPRPAA